MRQKSRHVASRRMEAALKSQFDVSRSPKQDESAQHAFTIVLLMPILLLLLLQDMFKQFPKASAKGSSSNCVAHTTQHNTTQHHTTARHTPARPTTAPHTTARHTPQQDATPPDRLILYSYYILNYFLAGVGSAQPSAMNPLQGSGVSERSRCGAVRILELADEPSTGIGRVGALSLWCRAYP